MTALGTAQRGVRWLWWYITELTGENAYHRYAERARRHDPAGPVLSRSVFERQRLDARDKDPRGGARCC